MNTAGSHARRLLVVEDEYLIAMDIKRTLERQEVEVIGPVASVTDALDLLNADRAIDGGVLDINLGGETVFSVCDVLQSLDIPFVFTTGYNAEDVPEVWRNITRLEKPVNPAQIMRALELADNAA